MANVKKANRVQDTDIKRLNHVGLGLKSIAELLGCHPATITLRLKAMGIDPTDTRRSFMEQVFLSLSKDEQEWLSHNLFNASIGIKDFVAGLIHEAYKANPAVVAAPPVAMPVMQTVTPTPVEVAVPEVKAEVVTPAPADDVQVKPEKVGDELPIAPVAETATVTSNEPPKSLFGGSGS